MEEPLLCQHKIVAIAAADAEMSEADAYVFCFGPSLFQFVACLDVSALIADACKPRTCRASLDIALREGSGNGVAAMVEDVVGRDVVHFHSGIVFLHSTQFFAILYVARQ